MKMYRDYDLVALQREAEHLRAQAMRQMLVALVRKVGALFGAHNKPHGGVAAGGNDFVLKPINREKLMSRIDKWIGRAHTIKTAV